MNLVHLVLVAFHCALALAGTRDFKLNKEHNAACLKVDSVGFNTSLVLDFKATSDYEETSVPVIVFNYLDLIKTKNVPSFVDFLNETYTNKKDTSPIVAYDENVVFNILHGDDETKVPDSFAFTSLSVFSEPQDVEDEDYTAPVLVYPITKEGVYCIYLPRYVWRSDEEQQFKLFPRPFEVNVAVENEEQPFGIEDDILTYAILTGALGFITVFINFYQENRDPSIIASQILYVFALNFLYYLVHLFLHLFALVSEEKTIALSIIEQYSKLQGLVLDNLARALVFLVYVGHGVIYDYTGRSSQSKFKPPKWTSVFERFLLAGFVGTLFLNHILVHKKNVSVVAININDIGFEVFANSVIFEKNYHYDIISSKVKESANLIYATSVANVMFTLVLFFYSLFKSFLVAVKVSKDHPSYLSAEDPKRNDKSTLATPFKWSIALHFILYKTIIIQVLYYVYLQPIQFSGFFDIGECLNIVSGAIEKNALIKKAIDYSDLIVLWLIWGYGQKGLKQSDVSGAPSEIKEVEKETKKDQ